ncbi:MAG: DUF3861 domain-containing protein [Zoogloeaceae bacterium]|jgi:hypothetical protein|nr:DUF3861 domain-containing protein [Zoogloeaceae bacterium]
MEKYRYRITLESLDALTEPRALQFDFGNRDDIFLILERLRQRDDFAAEEIPPFALGLKLLGKTLMENRENPLLASFKPHFVAFMRELKKGTPEKTG